MAFAAVRGDLRDEEGLTVADHSFGHPGWEGCAACRAAMDQDHAAMVEIRNSCSTWAEAGFAASRGDSPLHAKAATVAATHLLRVFSELTPQQTGLLVNYLFVNTVAHSVAAAGGYGQWLEGQVPDFQEFLAGFVASGGEECTCDCGGSIARRTLPGIFLDPHLTDVGDGEPV